MSWSNYDDVLAQLHAAGLVVDGLQVGTHRMVRCRVEGGDRERRGWYMLHEFSTSSGDLLIVGSFGVWHGNDNGAQKIELRKGDEFSKEQREALRKRLADDRRKAEVERQRIADVAAERASQIWAKLEPDGDSDYLDRKRVGAFGLRFTPNGSAVLPLLDVAGRIHGLQFLRTAAAARRGKRPEKEFWPKGLIKKGHFHLIGSPSWVVLVAEGYATAATLHMATGHPVAVAFDAGNLLPVVEALRKRYTRTRILICADDDTLGKCKHDDCRAHVVLALHPKECPACGRDHGYINAGVSFASSAALAVNGAWLAPTFADPDARNSAWLDGKGKRTDFNDQFIVEGLHVVRVQVEARLSELKWHAPTARPSIIGGEGRGAKLKPIESTHDLLQRFSLVYAHSGAVFDRQEHILLSLSDMRDACVRKDIHRGWVEHPARDIVRIREVGFDPTEADPQITCNLYGGWPTVAKAGSCTKLLDLLQYMCSADANAAALFKWVLKWIAYPIQHPGAKMKTALVVHGPQGTGKNLFFEAVMAIYGEYADVLDQSALEDKFNDWASRKLFMLADEVVAAADKYHIKNQLKALITGDRIRINPKNFAAYWERNHLNLVFLSNESMPVVLEEDDRRHCIIWTPEKRSAEYYADVMAEIRSGGIAALHDHLLNLDLGDFSPGAVAPKTAAKEELISLALDSPIRFYDELCLGDVHGLDLMPGLATDWFAAYKHWCQLNGMRAAPMPKFINALGRKRGVSSIRKRYRPADKELGPHAFLMVGQDAPPEGESESEWLGGCKARFASLLDGFRGGSK